ncbi:GMC oxidoreductase [Auricularia subglabra TFB-10046 SS5]|nr:GMC oxidoreductase [Auricularia subglabra TFB-10046 SS5]
MWPFSSTSYPVASLSEIAAKEFDFIVVGGGTAGCALAARLSEDANVQVLLLERGPAITSWISRVPLLSMDFRRPSSPAYKWTSEPLTAVNRLTNKIVSGKALGGTSKINASVYHRSVPGDYNAWARHGIRGWNWSDVEPLFNKSENSLSHGHLAHRGSSGPWKNRKPDNYWAHNLLIPKACSEIGLQYVDSANDPNAPSACCTRLEVTLGEDGLRQSSFDAFLPPALAHARKNLTICSGVIVTSVNFSRGEGPLRAVGVTVEAEKPGGAKVTVPARREIILSSGAIGTPHLLLLSGVGPASHLQEHGIEVVQDLPVGSSLQDHAGVAVMYKFPRRDTLHVAQDSPWLLLREFYRFLTQGKGIFLAPNPQLSIFALSQKLDKNSCTNAANPVDLDAADPDNVPDIEIMPIPFNARDPEFKDKLASKEGGFSFLCATLRPASQGTVRLGSSDCRVRPICDLATFSDAAEHDMKVMRAAIRVALRLAREMEAQGHVMPPLNVPESESDEDINAFIERDVQSTYHYSSSCRMSTDAESGVVDSELRVHGIRGLRICDASVFPQIPASHLQAPAVMLAERCAMLLKEVANLAAN